MDRFPSAKWHDVALVFFNWALWGAGAVGCLMLVGLSTTFSAFLLCAFLLFLVATYYFFLLATCYLRLSSSHFVLVSYHLASFDFDSLYTSGILWGRFRGGRPFQSSVAI